VGTDPELHQTIRNALAGDEQAFETVIARFARLVYAQAFAMLADHQDAEDVVQDTFVKAFRHRRQMREPQAFCGWLLTIARNAATDVLRRRRRTVLTENPVPRRVAEPGCVPVSRLEQKERRDELRAAVESLPPHYRTALWLRYFEGKAYRTVQNAMGVSHGALRGILERALGRLRRCLLEKRNPADGTLDRGPVPARLPARRAGDVGWVTD